MAGNFFSKFPGEVVEFDADASGFLVNGDTIASVSAVPISDLSGLTVTNARFLGSTVYFTVSGGRAGELPSVLFSANLASGQVREGVATILINTLPSS